MYITIILPVVSFGHETSSVTLREELGAEESIWTYKGGNGGGFRKTALI
jgi:hypothetical protein